MNSGQRCARSNRSTGAATSTFTALTGWDYRRPRLRPLARALQLATLGGALGAAIAHAAQPVVPLGGLDGRNGFRLDGATLADRSGRDVSAAGDINGDGIDDVVIGAPYGNMNMAGNGGGMSYVVFGRTAGDLAATFDLSALDGSNGFRLDGVVDSDYNGRAVSAAGDVNGDGIDDLLVSSLGSDVYALSSGSSYVLFGRSTGFASAINLSTLDGSTGFRLDGNGVREQSGYAVANAGDINGDGFDDLIIGSRASFNGSYSGSSYLVFGRSGGFA